METAPDYDISVSAGTVDRNTFYLDHSSEDLGIDERLVNLTAPESGSMTITIAPSTKALPRPVPLTMYGGPLQGDGFMCANVGDETSFGQWSYTDPDEYGTEHGTIYTGTKLCYELQPGYAIEVIKGGRVVRVGGVQLSHPHHGQRGRGHPGGRRRDGVRLRHRQAGRKV